jgi:hypothetical protein
LGDEPAPSESGAVNITFAMESQDQPATMTARRDALNRIASFGRRGLWLRTSDVTAHLRWCSARVNSLRMPESPSSTTDGIQRGTINWGVSYPRWLDKPDTALTLNPGKDDWVAGSDVVQSFSNPLLYFDGDSIVPKARLDDNTKFAAPRLFGRIKNGSVFTLNNAGSDDAWMKVRIYASVNWFPDGTYNTGDLGLMASGVGCSSISDIGLRQCNDWGATYNEWLWDSTLITQEWLDVNGEEESVKHRKTNRLIDAYSKFTAVSGDGFTRVPPGDTRFEVVADIDGAFAWIEIDYWNTYF